MGLRDWASGYGYGYGQGKGVQGQAVGFRVRDCTVGRGLGRRIGGWVGRLGFWVREEVGYGKRDVG